MGQDYLTGNGADFAMVFKLENICGTDVGSKANDGGALRPEKLLERLSGKEEPIRPCVPSHVAYGVGAARQRTVRSPRTMYPHS